MAAYDDILGIHATALRIRAERSQVLANNIANADTPNFQAKDINFQQALATAKQAHSVKLTATNSKHITDSNPGLNLDLNNSNSSQPTANGNTVDADVEKVRFTKNSVEYQISLTFLNQKINGLRTAIQGD